MPRMFCFHVDCTMNAPHCLHHDRHQLCILREPTYLGSKTATHIHIQGGGTASSHTAGEPGGYAGLHMRGVEGKRCKHVMQAPPFHACERSQVRQAVCSSTEALDNKKT